MTKEFPFAWTTFDLTAFNIRFLAIAAPNSFGFSHDCFELFHFLRRHVFEERSQRVIAVHLLIAKVSPVSDVGFLDLNPVTELYAFDNVRVVIDPAVNPAILAFDVNGPEMFGAV